LATLAARKLILAIGSYERYVSICLPMKANSNKILNNMGICFGVVWVACFVINAACAATSVEGYCFGEFGSMPTIPNYQTTVVFGVFITMTSFICAYCLIKAWGELKQMRLRNTTGGSDLMIRRSAQYIMIICVMYYFSYIPTLMAAIFSVIESVPEMVKSVTRWFALFYQALYGTLNILAYAYMTPGYWQQLRKLFKVNKTHPEVGPNTLPLTNTTRV